MHIKPIKTERDYRRVLKEIEGLMRARRGTPASERLDVLVTLAETWEARHSGNGRRSPSEATNRRGGREDPAAGATRPRRRAKPARPPREIHIRAVAFQEGGAWVVQGIEYDIAAHASDPAKVPAAFAKALLHNATISKHLGREPFEGIKPAPRRYREMFERSLTEVRAVDRAHDKSPPPIAGIDIRLAEPA
jgi:hypothetical protein